MAPEPQPVQILNSRKPRWYPTFLVYLYSFSPIECPPQQTTKFELIKSPSKPALRNI